MRDRTANADRDRIRIAIFGDGSNVDVEALAPTEKELAATAGKAARKSRETSTTAKPTDRRQRAQRFLKDTLAGGPKQVSAVEEAAAKSHVDPQALEQARGDLGHRHPAMPVIGFVLLGSHSIENTSQHQSQPVRVTNRREVLQGQNQREKRNVA